MLIEVVVMLPCYLHTYTQRDLCHNLMVKNKLTKDTVTIVIQVQLKQGITLTFFTTTCRHLILDGI